MNRVSRLALPSSRRQAFQTRCLLEALEPRTLMSNIVVTTGRDVVDPNDGVPSLREALEQANTSNAAE